MQRAHTCRGRRGSSRERPRQLRLARRLVRAARALQPPSGSRELSALAETVAAIQSCCGGRRPAPMRRQQPPPPARCCRQAAGVSRRPRPEPIRRTAPSSAEGSRQPLGGWSARAARTRRWASRSCRGRPREPPRRPRQACAPPPCAATRARALSRGCSRAPVAHCLAGWGITPNTLP